MSTPFIAEIKLLGCDFPPRGYAFCAGQILSIPQNSALFALLGTTYGGNGQSNFALPDLRGRAPIGAGQGPGLSQYVLGESSGTEMVTVNSNQMPAHTHFVQATSAAGTSNSPVGSTWAASVGGRTPPPLYSNTAPTLAMNGAAIGSAGGGQAHENMQPFLAMNFVIALQGIFPARN